MATPASARWFSSTFSNSSSRRPSTTDPNIWMRRPLESSTKCSSPVSLVKPATTSSLRPMLRTVSIIPGMENLAPERHDTSSGSAASPNVLPVRASTSASAAMI